MADDPDILDVIEAALLRQVAEARADRDANPVGYDYAFALRGLLDMVMGDLETQDMDARAAARREARREK